jgi:hypothetical protein
VTADASASDLAASAVGGARVAPAHHGMSVAVVALMMLLILFGAGAGLAAATWP